MVVNNTQPDYTSYKVRELVHTTRRLNGKPGPRRWVNVFGPCPTKDEVVRFLTRRGAAYYASGDWFIKDDGPPKNWRQYRIYIIDPESTLPTGEQIFGR